MLFDPRRDIAVLAVPDLATSAEGLAALSAVRTALGAGEAADNAVVQAVRLLSIRSRWSRHTKLRWSLRISAPGSRWDSHRIW